MEYLDIVNEHGLPTGQIVEREKAHAEGIMHRTSHVWVVRKRDDRIEILLQKRCDTKDSFPGCYDTSSAGHIPAGVDFAPSAVRELKEELGIEANEEELIFCGDRTEAWDSVFHSKPYHDRQYYRVFALWRDLEESDFHLQAEEVSAVRWMELDEVIAAVNEDTILHCISLDELRMVKQAIQPST